ncbi:hypothetical protein ACSC1U_03940 [Mammaliicoccus lentus]
MVDNDKLKTELDNLNIKTVNKNTKRYFKLYSKSMVWISNTRLSPK